MVGGLVIPTNSPHLRKSGSRTVVSDLDNNEAENGVDEGLLHSIELNDLRGVTMPMTISASAIMPSPVLLWRFKVLMFLCWSFICCKIGWNSVMRMSADKRDLFLYEAFLYYNPLLLATLMVWLWGINLWFFAQAGVNYAKIFDFEQNHLSHREIWKVKCYRCCREFRGFGEEKREKMRNRKKMRGTEQKRGETEEPSRGKGKRKSGDALIHSS